MHTKLSILGWPFIEVPLGNLELNYHISSKNKGICSAFTINRSSSKYYIHSSFSISTTLYTATDFLTSGVRSGYKYKWRICRAFNSSKRVGDKIFAGCFPNGSTITSVQSFSVSDLSSVPYTAIVLPTRSATRSCSLKPEEKASIISHGCWEAFCQFRC